MLGPPHPSPLALDSAKLRANLQGARRGAAAGPSSATAEHLRVLLDDEDCCDLLVAAAHRLAQADVPDAVAAGLRLGRMVALLKPSGGIRALVMGDVFRRLVSRTLAQQFSTPLQEACAPYQYALSTRAGAEALARALRVATDSSTSTTVVSVDGVGAYDHISRRCMFDGLFASPALAPLIPLVRLFYGGDSEYLFYDASGAAHSVLQSEGGEQGTLSCPAYSLYASTRRCGPHTPLLNRARTCLRSWMTRTFPAPLQTAPPPHSGPCVTL